MPIYDYRCDHCGHAFSAVQSYKDQPLEKCPKCGKKPRRLIGSPAIVFKGSGWYKTDSRPAEKTEKTGGTTETKSDAKTETKSDKKSETKPSGDGGQSPPTRKSEASS
ncbi:MAG: FmdB family transcriptional regulator [Chloroflexi bacterium]|nr:MAG: FmdB family transcriptional regulator [Chloroflexota bacterium]